MKNEKPIDKGAGKVCGQLFFILAASCSSMSASRKWIFFRGRFSSFFVEIFAVRRCNEPGMARKLFFETKPHMMLNQRVAIVLKNVRNASLIAEIEDFLW